MKRTITGWVVLILAFHTGMVLHRWLLPGLGTMRLVLASLAFAMGLLASLAVHELVRTKKSREGGTVHGAITAWAATIVSAFVITAGVAIASAPWPESLSDLDRLGAPGVVLLEIAAVNVLLAGLHLLPVYPLDAGRVIAAHANRRVLSLAGFAIGAAFVAAGVVVAVSGVSTLLAVWCAGIGWFLASAATQPAALKPAEA
jgi:Zn-dependent protease